MAGRFEDRRGLDLGSRLRDAPTGPLTHKGDRSGRWQWPHPVLHVPRRAAAAPALVVEHRSIWLLIRVIGGRVEVGGLTTVGELHTEAEELIGERVA
jgi:hypothetical protein